MINYIIDIDGTLLNGEKTLKNAGTFISKLQSMNYQILLATNSVKNPGHQQARLKKAGIQVNMEQIYSPIDSINFYIKTSHLERVYVIGSEQEISQINAIQDEKNPGLIILLDFEKNNISYQQLQLIINHAESNCPIITASRSPFYLIDQKKRIDTGAFVQLIESIIDKKIPVFGKPSADYYLSALQKFTNPDLPTWMVGDDWQTDIIGAQKVGLKTILVKTGKYKEGDEIKSNPDRLIENLGEFESMI
ncbi:MAG: HAD-IIA family hydrolase [Spirochaetes bacterium]|nr:HAD-IIA family hydrolase [Spirochaetota bacterium]